MEQRQQCPEVCDFRQHDHIWQRVAPGLEPYPAARQATEAVIEPILPQEGRGTIRGSAVQIRQGSLLPGEDPNPCCMGTAAEESLKVLTGFLEEELRDQRIYQTMARQAPSWARQKFRELAAEEGEHARRLAAVHYLITGSCYQPAISMERLCLGNWCAALRERYHEAACNGLNYARAAEETTDLCLKRLLNELSGAEYRHADTFLTMLERSLKG